MGDAFGALIDAAGLDVRYGHEVLAADDRWTLDLDPAHDGVWIASSFRTDVWVRQGPDASVFRQGTAALYTTGVPLTVGTDLDRALPPASDGGWSDPTGVHIGTASFGPLAAEAFPLARVVRTQPPEAPHADVVRLLTLLESMSGAPWCEAARHTLATSVVLTILHGNPPSFLADTSIARCIDRLVDADRPVPSDVLGRGTRMSASTIRRRFRATTGCSPDGLRRWFRSLPVRAALAEGTEPDEVAQRFGFSTVGSMRRALARVRAPDTHVRSAF